MSAIRRVVTALAALAFFTASPAMACKNILGQSTVIVTAEAMDAGYAASATVVAFGTVVERSDGGARIDFSTSLRGPVVEDFTLPDEVMLSCDRPMLRNLPDNLSVGDEVVFLKGHYDGIDFGFVEQIHGPRGVRLLTIVSNPEPQ